MARILLVLLLMALPSFSLMLRPGIYTMHDFHIFRQFEFDKCLKEGTFPCRWAPDASKGYGQPLFNFYAQFPYWLGELFHLTGFQIIDSVKILFLLSLSLSAVSMYFLASRFWDRLGGVVSAIFYVYAPYRAVDVWVRGALPEALSFVLFPLILLFLEKKSFLLLSLSLSLLLITHNLSLLMFLPFLGLWWLIRSRDWQVVPAGLLALLLSAFYLLPVVAESHLVSLSQTVSDYYNYLIHFTTLRELFLSRFWGYGASLWAQKFLSVSAGHLHWAVPLTILVTLTFKYSALCPSPNLGAGIKGRSMKTFGIAILLGVFALFLTHGKSAPIWNALPPMAYIQFPWRFLSVSTFFLSLSVGAASVYLGRIIPLLLTTLVILVNFSFFRPDIWREVADSGQFSGLLWDEQRSSALSDFWPKAPSRLPTDFADFPQVLMGEAKILPEYSGAHKFKYSIDVFSSYAKIQFPMVYFPGWTALLDGKIHPIFPQGDLGQITTRILQGKHSLNLTFSDTFPRTLGNIISALSAMGVISFVTLAKRG